MATQVKIKVISAKSTDWYYTHMNECFTGSTHPEYPDYWKIEEPQDGFNYIKKSDCQAENIIDFSEEEPKMIKVRITKADSKKWYKGRIGKIVSVLSKCYGIEDAQNWYNYKGEGRYFISKDDCEIVSDNEEAKVLEAVGKPEYIYFGEKAPFDLEKALAGEPVVQRDGVEIIELRYFRNAGHGFNIYALAEGDAAPTAYTKSGKLFDHRDSQSDLFMKVQVVEQFMNVFNDHESNQMKWYDSRNEADNFASKNRIGILKKTTPKGTKEHSLQLIPL